jgi:RNA polymerase sigma-70 factor (TIGR02943 family)
VSFRQPATGRADGRARNSQPQSLGLGLPSRLDPESWVERHGDDLFGFALARVRNRAIAQDLVQETFLAGIKSGEGFAGRSSERSWLFGILRNKLADYCRLQNREEEITDTEPPLPEERGAFGTRGLGKDGWVMKLAPQAWETPDETLISKEFQDVLRSCLSRLPDKVAQVFRLREIDDVSSEEISKDFVARPTSQCAVDLAPIFSKEGSSH